MIALGLEQRRLDRADHLLGYLILHGEHLDQGEVVTIRPELVAAGGIDQLGRNPHLPVRIAHAAFEDVSHAEFMRDLPGIDRLALVGEAGIAGDDEEPAIARERGDDVFGDAVGKILLLLVAAEVGERQDGRIGPDFLH